MPAFACLLLTLNQTDWKPYSLGGFGFRLPAPPVEKQMKPAPPGTRYWLSMHNGKNAIVIGIVPLSAEARKTPDVQLAAAVAGSLAEPGSSLLAQRDAWVSGWPALDYRYRDPSGLTSWVRVVVVDGRIVQIGVTGFSEVALKGPFRLAVADLTLPAGTPKGPQSGPGPTFAPYPLGGGLASVGLPRAHSVETLPVNDRTGALVLHRYSSSYANRFYLAAYADLTDANDLPKATATRPFGSSTMTRSVA